MLNKLLAFPLLAVVAVMAPLQAMAQQTPSPAPEWYGPGPWHMWGGGYGFWWGPFFMLIVFALVIGAVVLLFGGRRHGLHSGGPGWGPDGRHHGHSALEILGERFARGEIQKDEYEAKRKTILGRD